MIYDYVFSISDRGDGYIHIRAGIRYNKKQVFVNYLIPPSIMDENWQKRESKAVVRILHEIYKET